MKPTYTAHIIKTPDNATLTYFRWRQGTLPRPAVVLLHGLGSNYTRWLEFIEKSALSHHYDIFVPDLRGHGDSVTSGIISMEKWTQDLAQILRQENYHDAVIIGHSLGAHLAHFFAHRYPKYVRGLVLIDPLSHQDFTPSIRLLWRLRALAYLLLFILLILNRLGIKRRSLPRRNLRLLDTQARQLIAQGRYAEMIKLYSSVWTDLKYNPTANYLQYTLQVLRPLPQIKNNPVPVLLLLSSGSSYNTGKAHNGFGEQFSRCTQKVVHCNHWLLTEKPDEACQFIVQWFDQVFPQD